MSDSLRVAIYSQDSLGLGHLRRNTLIGRCLLEQSEDTNILLFMDSPTGTFFALPRGMDHMKLPSIRKIDAGQWQATVLQIDTPALQRWRADLLRGALTHYRPDVVLVDHMPGGAQGELIPALKALKQTHPNSSVVLGLRDILDRQEIIARVWQREGAYGALRLYYDRILIYGNREIFDTARIYRLPVPPRGIRYCGYVVNRCPVQRASSVRQAVRARGKQLVYVSAGGGADSALLMHTYVRAIRKLGGRVDFATIMAVGVHAPPDVHRAIESEAVGLPIDVVSHIADGLSTMAAADLVVCMAGYNTLAEVLSLRKKALVVPRAGPSAEQKMRAKLFAERGLVDWLDPHDVTPERLAERLVEDLARDDFPAHDTAIDMSGATLAARHALEVAKARVGSRDEEKLCSRHLAGA